MSDKVRKIIESSIKRYVNRNISKFCFKIGFFNVPKEIITNHKKRINIERNREKLLKQGNSPFAFEMGIYLTNQCIRFTREFIVIIQDIAAWEFMIDSYCETDEEKNKYKLTNYFSLDFFLMDNLTCIEIDSNYHIEKKNFDMARDAYLETVYNIKTIRLYHFGENKIEDEPKLRRLKERVMRVNSDPTRLFNYFDVAMNNFIYGKENLLCLIENFIEFVGGFSNFIKSRKFIITEKDYNNIAQGIDFGGKLSDLIMFSDDFVELINNLFYCEVRVYKNITSYGIGDINYIIQNRNNNSIVNNIMYLYNRIPYWTTYFVNIDNRMLSFIIPESGEDTILIKYLKEDSAL